MLENEVLESHPLGVFLQVKGKCAKKEEAPIIVSNHVSPFEPFFLVSQTQATPVQRIEDSRAPIVGKIQRAMQVLEGGGGGRGGQVGLHL